MRANLRVQPQRESPIRAVRVKCGKNAEQRRRSTTFGYGRVRPDTTKTDFHLRELRQTAVFVGLIIPRSGVRIPPGPLVFPRFLLGISREIAW